jgi:hypothetical protein
MTLDRRLYAYKDDVADAKLRGKVQALRYVTPELRQVTVSIAPVLREPRYDAPTDTQALLGEPVHVFQIKDGWAFVQLVIDHYVGFIPARCLSSQVIDPTHRIAVPQTLLYTRARHQVEPGATGLHELACIRGVRRWRSRQAARPPLRLGPPPAPH